MLLRLTFLVAVILVVPLMAWTAEASAPAPQWSFDPPHCSILFTVRHIFVPIPGRFADYSGTVRFDPENLAGSSIDVNVQMASVDTFVAKRDEDLRSPDFFDTTRYPVMSFVSERIERRQGNQYAAVGRLTIKDVTRQIELPFTFYGVKASPLVQGKQVAGFEAHFSVNLLDYHVGDGRFQRMGAMGDTAGVTLYLELIR